MTYILSGHSRKNAVQDMLICLLPEEEHAQADCDSGGDACISRVETSPDGVATARALVRRGGLQTQGMHSAAVPAGAQEAKRIISYAVKTSLYHALLPHLGQAPVWGSLTGVKPAKAVRLQLENGMPAPRAQAFLQEEYFVAPSRAALCVKAAQAALEAWRQLRQREVQLYVGIPFCPAKCAYCSFVSNDTKTSGHLIAPYLEALAGEIAAAGRMVRDNGLSIGSLYIGGGTPTILSAPQLDGLLAALGAEFNLGHCREITVEAGRPETIDSQKLAVLAAHGVSRLSINPQTMNDSVLAGVGRHHTAGDIERVYAMARDAGDFIINMDLIAGLPGDHDQSLVDSVGRVAALAPENITIHCLARKKGAALRFGRQGVLPAATLDRCYDILAAGGWQAYYLYRQKYIAGGLENIGFARGQSVSFYNICMMEELGDTIALGAGGVTKLCPGGGEKIIRLGNPKYPREYISGAVAIAQKKAALLL